MSEFLTLVRPLRWKEPHPSITYPNWYAMDLNVKFEARIDTSKPSMYGKFPLSINGALVVQKFDTADEAKAYAQQQYAGRVAACLIPDRITRLESDVEVLRLLSDADAITSTGNGRGGRKITFDFESCEPEIMAHSALMEALSRISGEDRHD